MSLLLSVTRYQSLVISLEARHAGPPLDHDAAQAWPGLPGSPPYRLPASWKLTTGRGTKQVLRFWRDLMMAEQSRYYQAVMHRVLLSGDVFEGPRAFAEKREPQFSAGWPDPFARPPRASDS